MRRLARILAIFCTVSVFPALATAGPALDLIETLGNRAETAINDRSLTADERMEKLRAALGEVIDQEGMARSLLGRNWRRADDGQKAKLVPLLQTYLINAYAGRVDSVDGVIDLVVDGERTTSDRTLVSSRVVRPNGPPVDVDWQVETADGRLAVTDIVVEGVSLVVSQRADFASVIRRQGGVDGLIELLEQKVAQKN